MNSSAGDGLKMIAGSARTKRIRIASGVLLMPFHNPVRLAEDIAVVDVISGGRLELGVGVGYKLEEFQSFGVPFKERGARTNEALGIVRRLLAGETVTLKNQFFDLNSEIQAQGCIVRVSIAYLPRSIPPNFKGWAWGWLSAARLSRPTAGGCGQYQTMVPAQRFSLLCRSTSRRPKKTHILRYAKSPRSRN